MPDLVAYEPEALVAEALSEAEAAVEVKVEK